MAKFIRSFQIESTEFTLIQGAEKLSLHSHHPYDNTDYHWAVLDPHDGSWRVFREGRYQITLGGPMTFLSPEQAAAKLLALDKAAGLKPRIETR